MGSQNASEFGFDMHAPTPVSSDITTNTSEQSDIQDSSETNRQHALMNECTMCLVAESPLWRKGPDGKRLCNACGLRVRHELKKQQSELSQYDTRQHHAIMGLL